MKTNERVVIIGAGSVGTNLAIFLSRLGIEAILLEPSRHILTGAAMTTFINHGDGFEYFKKGHYQTGKLCIDGSIAKALLIPIKEFRNENLSTSSHVRFFLSSLTCDEENISVSDFAQNVRAMAEHFTQKFNFLAQEPTHDKQSIEFLLGRSPDGFYRELDSKLISKQIQGVVAGYEGSSFGVSMANYYAYQCAMLNRLRIKCICDANIESIERSRDNVYSVEVNGTKFSCSHVFLCSSHNAIRHAKLIRGAGEIRACRGVFFLNSMTFITLPATADLHIRQAAENINFTLQQSSGCMFACIVPPTETDQGLAAIYYPSTDGSQIDGFVVDSPRQEVPAEWQGYLADGLALNDTNVERTLWQASKVYPFLKNYGVLHSVKCRTVFNQSTVNNINGEDRRVRDLSSDACKITLDGNVTQWAAPKWTNAELVSLLAADYFIERLTGTGLPKSATRGLGPTNLDIIQIAKQLNLPNVIGGRPDKLRYCQLAGLPSRMIL